MKFYLILSLLLAVANCSLCGAAGNLKGSRVKQSTVTENQLKTLTTDPKKERAKLAIKGLAKNAALEAKKSAFNSVSKKSLKNRKPVSHVTDSKSSDIKVMDGHEEEPEMVAVSLGELTTTGWGIQKIRPNADCTGKVRTQSGVALGYCLAEEGVSYYLACDETEEDYTNIRSVIFDSSEDCTGDYTVYSNPDFGGNENPRCNTAVSLTDPDFLEDEGYATISSGCRAKSSLDKFEGLVITSHFTDDCSDAPFFHFNIRNGGCLLNVNDGEDDDDESESDDGTMADHDDENDDDEIRFEYTKYNCDEESGTLKVNFYTDATCSGKKFYDFELPLAEVFEGEYKQCFLDEDDDDDSEEEGDHGDDEEDEPMWQYLTCNSS